ncbi:SDR family oxidoreductase [Pontibacter sp. G13]|uniref:SDR family NAD(P)-dependent oxidoreductase n=1 Tax=Pontibacter sp. G13 TaxID=3074898 RepID=UPI00288C30B6|nr:SDR family oxidoreductase [Pontibacter sp. G13]WNJ18667.1 SDR family oxidoreductase [Pontibacter sp. G13]
MQHPKWLLIGGSRGIGRALALLASDEYDITLISRTDPEIPGIDWVEGDATKDDLPDIPGPISGLAYFPGTINLKPFKGLKEKDFQSDFEVNVLGAIRVLQHYESALKASGNASVVLFSTVAVQTGMPFHASVAASKGAIEGLTRSLASEWAPAVRVNAIAPSIVDTPLAARLLRSEKQREASAERHPLKRIGDAQEVAQLAKFLLSEDAGWISGQVLKLDGGMSSLRGL